MKQQYVFCADNDYVEKLKLDGYVVVNKQIIDSNELYILLPPKNKKFDKLDKDKCFFSDKRFF